MPRARTAICSVSLYTKGATVSKKQPHVAYTCQWNHSRRPWLSVPSRIITMQHARRTAPTRNWVSWLAGTGTKLPWTESCVITGVLYLKSTRIGMWFIYKAIVADVPRLVLIHSINLRHFKLIFYHLGSSFSVDAVLTVLMQVFQESSMKTSCIYLVQYGFYVWRHSLTHIWISCKVHCSSLWISLVKSTDDGTSCTMCTRLTTWLLMPRGMVCLTILAVLNMHTHCSSCSVWMTLWNRLFITAEMHKECSFIFITLLPY